MCLGSLLKNEYDKCFCFEGLQTREVRQLIEQKKKEKIERERKEQIEKEKQRRKEGHLIRNQMEEYEKIVRQQEVQQQMKMREETKV